MISVARKPYNANSVWRFSIASLAFLIASCGGGGGSGGSGSGGGSDEPQVLCEGDNAGQCSLEALGVDVDYTPRVVQREDGSRVELPAPQEFAPMGANPKLGAPDEQAKAGGSSGNAFAAELAVAGLHVADQADGVGRLGVFDMTPESPVNDPDTGGVEYPYTYKLLDDVDPWESATSRPSEPILASVAADIDDDPADELVTIVRDAGSAGDCPALMYHDRSDDVTSRHAVDVILPCSSPAPDDFAIESGDFDGDGDEDLAIGYMTNASSLVEASVFILRNEGNGVFALPNEDTTWYYTASDFTDSNGDVPVVREIQLSLEAGALDWDNPDELVVVANAYNREVENASDARSRFYVYDKKGRGTKKLKMRLAAGNRPPITNALAATVSDGNVLTPSVADVALGDFDADGLQEIALVGLNRIGDACGLDADYTVTILRDLFNFTVTHEDGHQAGVYKPLEPISTACTGGVVQRLTYVHAAAGNLDKADTADELVVNNLVFDDIKDDKSLARHPDFEVPRKQLMFNEAVSAGFHWNNSAVVAADTTNDGRDNILFHWRPGDDYSRPIRAWGEHDIEGWMEYYTVSTSTPSSAGTAARLQLTPIDWADDGPVVEYEYAGYRLVFTEPEIIAAVAAPPCDASIGQKLDWCFTSYGQSRSLTGGEATGTGVAGEGTFYGVIDVNTLPVAVRAEAGVYSSHRRGTLSEESYTTTIDLNRATGALESSVMFSVVPLDTYAYRVVSHPDPNRVGDVAYEEAPREPVTLMAPIDYFNERLAPEYRDLAIDERIFQHEDGKPTTYPSCGEMQALRDDSDTTAFIPKPGQEGDVSFDVGPGSGFTKIGIWTGQTSTETYSHLSQDGWYASIEARVGGKHVKVGGGVSTRNGTYREHSISMAWDETDGAFAQVTEVAPDLYPDNAYRVGMFQYTQSMERDNGKEVSFNVVNFWTTPYDEVDEVGCSTEAWDPGELDPPHAN